MTAPEILIFSRPIRTGKTTELEAWLRGKNGGGVLMPDVEGVRHIRDIRTGEQRPVQLPAWKGGTITVGRFYFDAAVFLWAQAILQDTIEEEIDWLVIDEIGKLELAGEGFALALSAILAERRSFGLLLVVREGLVHAVKTAFQLNDVTIVDKLPHD